MKLVDKEVKFDSPVYTKKLNQFATNTLYTVSAKQRIDPLGKLSKPMSQTFAQHKALGKAISFKYPPAEQGAKRINDGLFAYDQFYDVNKFAVFYGTDLDATIDLTKHMAVSSIVMGVDTGRHRQLHPPKHVSVYVSDNKQNWQLVSMLTAAQINGPLLTLTFEKRRARYVRVVAINANNSSDPQIPKLPLYIDEIAVF